MGMSEERKLILNLLAEGKITSEEAEELLDAIEQDETASTGEGPAAYEEGERVRGEAGEGPAPGAKAEGPRRPRINIDISPDLEDRVQDVAGEIEELVQDIPEKVQKALESVQIKRGGKKSTLAEMLSSWGLGEFGGTTANPKFKIGTAEVSGRLPVSVALVSGTVVVKENGEDTNIRVLSRVNVNNANGADVQKIAAQHIEVYFDPKRGLRVKSADSRDVSVLGVEVLLPSNLTYDITASSVNGSVRCYGASASSATLRTTNGSILVEGCKFDRLDTQTVNGSVRLNGDFRDISGGTVNGSIRGEMALLGGNVRLTSSNGSIKIGLDRGRSAPLQIAASSRHGSVRMDEPERYEVLEDPSSGSLHKSGLWRTVGYQGAAVKADVELETRNGSVIVTEA